MARFLVLLYAIVCYLAFFATLLYTIGFVGDFVVPKSVSSGTAGPVLPALAINVALLLLFGIQHSVMARRPFKAWLTRLIPDGAERSTYVLASSLALIILYAFWQPLPGTVWLVEGGVGAIVLWAVFAVGWALVLLSSFMIDHFELFGLQQAWSYFRGRPQTPIPFKTPYLYRYVRHPLQLGFLLAFWATPYMTVSHLMFSVGMTVYILVGLVYEERDLIRFHADKYHQYRHTVPKLVPFTKRGRPGDMPDLFD